MKYFFVCMILLIAAGGGCGHKKPPAPKVSETASETTPEVSNDSVPPPAASAPATVSPRPSPAPARMPTAEPVRIESESLFGIVHPFMTDQLKKFIEENGRFPQDFGEFASARMDSVPRAPEGFRFAIDRTTVEVKLVKK